MSQLATVPANEAILKHLRAYYADRVKHDMDPLVTEQVLEVIINLRVEVLEARTLDPIMKTPGMIESSPAAIKQYATAQVLQAPPPPEDACPSAQPPAWTQPNAKQSDVFNW